MSNQTKHTPGPWMAVKGDVLNPDRPWGVVKYLTLQECQEIDGDDATWPSRTVVLAEVTAGAPCDEADARLIAASPELLEALQEMLLNSPLDGSYGPPAHSLHKARTAIAKATGGQP